MKTGRAAVALLPVLLAGCMSGPRPYDGVLGYQLSTTPAGLQVTYVDEARVAPEKTRRKVGQVCAAELKAEAAQVAVKVESEAMFEQAVAMSVPIPVTTIATTSTKTGHSPWGQTGQVQDTVVYNEAASRALKLRRTIATCSR